MGFFSNIVSATIKTVLTPIAVAKDVLNVVVGEEPEATKDLLDSAKDDAEEAMEDLVDGEM